MRSAALKARSGRTMPRGPVVAAVSVALMVLGGFAMLAVVPVAFLVRRTFRERSLRPLRPWAVGLAVTYATPLVLWAALPDRAPSLTKDMHPVFVPLIVAASVTYLVAYAVVSRRAARTGSLGTPPVRGSSPSASLLRTADPRQQGS